MGPHLMCDDSVDKMITTTTKEEIKLEVHNFEVRSGAVSSNI